MMRIKPIFQAALAGIFLAGLAVQSAPVAPNPKSLLKGKRVLIVEATNWNGGSHSTPKGNALKKLQLIKTAVGITSLTVVDNVADYTLATLNNYDIMVFNYVFNTQMAVGKPFENAFKQWLAQGNKGWMGYHTSGANDVGEWPWYRDSVTAMRYHVHSTSAQQGKMTITTDAGIKALPILAGMDAEFTGTDEWYDFDLPPRAPAPATWADCKVLYYLDENTLASKPSRPMNPHPMAWIREDARKNKFFYAAYIHSDVGSNSDFFHSSLLRGLEFVAGYDTAVAISAQGNSIRTLENMSYVTNSRELRVELDGKYRLTVFSAKGRKVFSAAGEGRKAYHPAAFAKAGLYIVKLESKGAKVSQRLMIY
jgi:hypothetical protein